MYFPDKIMRWFSNSCFLHLLHWFLPLSSWPTWRWTRWLTRWPTWRPTKTSREPFYLKIAYGTLLQEPNDVLRAIQEIEKSREKEAVTIIWIWIQSFLKTFLIPVGIMAFFSSGGFHEFEPRLPHSPVGRVHHFAIKPCMYCMYCMYIVLGV